LATAHPQHARVHLTQTKLRRGVEVPSPLLLLLRKHVRGGRVTAVRWPQFERILEIKFENETIHTLVIEAMGRHSNLILVDADGSVLDSLKRVGPRLSRVRPILPGWVYKRPPPQAKLDPADVGEADLETMLAAAQAAQPVWRVLVNGIRAVSPLLAREIVYRATGRVETKVRELDDAATQLPALLETLHGLLIHVWEADWQPHVALEEGEVVAYAPYALTQYPAHEATETIGLAIDRYYQATRPGASYAAAKERVQALLDEARTRAINRRRALQRQLVPQEELDRLRLCGEMTLAYAHAVQPGDTRLEAEVELDGPPLAIDLDPKLSAVENAQAYFERYQKAKSASREIPRRLRRAEHELAYLDQLQSDLALASNRPDIEEVRSALVEAGYAAQPKGSKPQRGQPLRVATDEGPIILVGRSARQNHQITFRRAGPDDLWLHAVDVPGSHVVILSGGRPVSEAVLRQAAQLAAQHSAAQSEAGVLVAYTQRRYVRPIRGGRPGMVTYRREETIRVSGGIGEFGP
jgi:predicted ribosome quality control (RQC) complex YloA/Tae2 family protein